MNTKKFLLAGVLLALVLLTACAGAEATETILPTEQEAAEEAPPVMDQVVDEKELGVENEWRHQRSRKGAMWATNAELVFETGDKCSLTIYQDATSNGFAYKILVKDDTYDNYMVSIDTLDEGYTIEDIRAYEDPNTHPSFTNLIRYDVFDPGSTTFSGSTINIEEGEYYFTCMVQGGDEHKIIGVVGPLTVH